MMEAFPLGPPIGPMPKIKRVNRLPIYAGVTLVTCLIAVVTFGLASRGLKDWDPAGGHDSVKPASREGDRLKRGIPDGIIGDPTYEVGPPNSAPATGPMPPASEPERNSALGPPLVLDDWRDRLEKEQNEQVLRELHRQRMASLQADDAAKDSPIVVELASLGTPSTASDLPNRQAPGIGATMRPFPSPSYGDIAMGGATIDSNGQLAKADFLNQRVIGPGTSQNTLAMPRSPYELKRGSVIPATLITGVNSDLPGRIIAQVSQPVFDSATGRHLLIPQGSRLLGRYDANVSFGQERVLVIWTDIILPDGSTLRIEGMAGTDSAGYGGFNDQVDHHTFRTFASAALVAFIGTGSELLMPSGSQSGDNRNNVQDAAGRSFAETFGQVSNQTVTKNLNVQPTINIRPGYHFNVLVDQDLSFDANFGGRF